MGGLDDHVEDIIALVGKERNVMEGDDRSALFDIDVMLWWGVGESTGADVREISRNLSNVLGAPRTQGELCGR